MSIGPTISTLLVAASSAKPGVTIFGMPKDQASTVAPTVDLVYNVVTWIMVIFFVKIMVVMFWFMWKYRRRSHVADTGGLTHHTPLEVTWTVIPLILVIAIFYVGLKGYVHITTPPENTYDIQVTGQRWFWTFNYPNGASETPTLHVPVNRPVKLEMTSDDVLHSFFVPAFRVKQDVVPGKRTEIWFEASREGTFQYFCAEYCGTQHSQMVGQVVVYGQDEFDVIIEELAAWIDKVPDDKLPLAGAILYNRCSSCHTLDGSQLIGPSFKETHDLFTSGGSRSLKGGGSAVVDADYIRDSIVNPLDRTAIDASSGSPYPNSMPPGISKQLGPRGVEAMVAFITNLDEAAPGGQLVAVDRAEITIDAPEGDQP